MLRTKNTLPLTLAALVAAFSFHGNLLAAPGAPQASETATTTTSASATISEKGSTSHPHKMRHHKHQRDTALVVPGYGAVGEKFVQTLGLTEAQTKLVADAKAAQKEIRDGRREAMKQAKATRAEQLKAGKLDPLATIKQSQGIHEKAAQQHQSLNQKWLAVWDALNPEQQTKVATHLSERAEKRAERMNTRGEHDGKRHHGHRADKAPDAPAAASPTRAATNS